MFSYAAYKTDSCDDTKTREIITDEPNKVCSKEDCDDTGCENRKLFY